MNQSVNACRCNAHLCAPIPQNHFESRRPKRRFSGAATSTSSSSVLRRNYRLGRVRRWRLPRHRFAYKNEKFGQIFIALITHTCTAHLHICERRRSECCGRLRFFRSPFCYIDWALIVLRNSGLTRPSQSLVKLLYIYFSLCFRIDVRRWPCRLNNGRQLHLGLA